MGFDRIARREGMNKVVEVVAILVFDTKIVDDEDESNGAGKVTKQAWGGGFNKPKLFENRDQHVVGELARFLEAVNCLVGSE